MPFSPEQANWIDYAAGHSADPADYAEKQEQRIAFLEEELGPYLDSAQQSIADAQSFDVVFQREGDEGLLQSIWYSLSLKGSYEVTIPWSVGNDPMAQTLEKYALWADGEVDTRHDIRDIDNDRLTQKVMEIPPEDLQKLMAAYQKILAAQEAMELQLAPDGTPLFSAADIRKELWTPMVRSGLIPENMVPQEYSEQAVAFDGAQQFYSEKIAEYSASHNSRQDAIKRGLGLGKELVTVAKASAFLRLDALQYETKSDIRLLEAERDELRVQTSSSPDLEKIEERLEAAKTKQAKLANAKVHWDTTAEVLSGGLSLGEVATDVYYDQDNKTLIELRTTLGKAWKAAETMTTNAVFSFLQPSADTDSEVATAQRADAKSVKLAIQAGFSSAQGIGSLYNACRGEFDNKTRARLVNDLILSLSEGVAKSIEARAEQCDDDARKQMFQNIASWIKAAAKAEKNGAAVLEAAMKGNAQQAGLMLGTLLICGAFGAKAGDIKDNLRVTVDPDEFDQMGEIEKLFAIKGGAGLDERQQAAEIAARDAIAGEMSKFPQATAYLAPSPQEMVALSEEKMKAALAVKLAEMREEQEAQAKELLRELFADDDHVAALLQDAEADIQGFAAAYSDAIPDTSGDYLDAEMEEAQAAISRAMENAVKLRQKVAMVHGLAAGGAGILAALVPGAGLVVAGEKLVKDLYTLKKCVETHNAWVDNTTLSLSSQSAIAPPIQRLLSDAEIEFEHATIRVVLAGLQLTNETARLFDPSGITSVTKAGLTLTSAVTEFGYKVHSEAQMRAGWIAYRNAIADRGDRKAARNALRMNTTLAKCSLAYGATIMGDPIAKQAVISTGLTAAALQDDKDICVRVIQYLEASLSETNSVLRAQAGGASDWRPGTPELSFASWMAHKTAAVSVARPAMDRESAKTPAIDTLLRDLAGAAELRDTDAWEQIAGPMQAEKAQDPSASIPLSDDAQSLKEEVETAIDRFARLQRALEVYAPLQDGGGARHMDMGDAANAFALLAQTQRSAMEAFLRRINDLERELDS